MEGWLEDQIRTYVKDRYLESIDTFYVNVVADEVQEHFRLELNADDRIELEYLIETVHEEMIDEEEEFGYENHGGFEETEDDE